MTADNSTLGERKLERSKRKFDRAWHWGIAGFVLLALVIGYTIIFHDITKQDASNASCEALHRSLRVVERYIIHQEGKSIENVEAGITSSTTSIPELRQFYQPTIEEIHDISC